MRNFNQYSILTALQRSDAFVMRAARVLYLRQTLDERAIAMSVHVNVLGFNRADAVTMTAICEASVITGMDIEIARGRVAKYARQLADHANGNRVDFGAAVTDAVSVR